MPLVERDGIVMEGHWGKTVPRGTPRAEAYRLVWEKYYAQTTGGLGREDLMMVGNRIVSKRAHENGVQRWANMSEEHMAKFQAQQNRRRRGSSRRRRVPRDE